MSQSFDPKVQYLKATQLEQFLIVWHGPVIILKKIQVLLGKYVYLLIAQSIGKYT